MRIDDLPPLIRKPARFTALLGAIVLRPSRSRRIRLSMEQIVGGSRDLATFDALVDAWASDWSADGRFLKQIAEQIDATSGPVFEAGSGLTSLMIHALTRARNRSFVCVEHNVGMYILNGIEAVLSGVRGLDIKYARLCTYDNFSWYGISPSVELADHYDLVICDGPPSTTRGGRYGIVPVLGDRLAGATLLLDDADRPGEQAAIGRWTADRPASTVDVVAATHAYKAHATIRIG